MIVAFLVENRLLLDDGLAVRIEFGLFTLALTCFSLFWLFLSFTFALSFSTFDLVFWWSIYPGHY